MCIFLKKQIHFPVTQTNLDIEVRKRVWKISNASSDNNKSINGGLNDESLSKERKSNPVFDRNK